MEKNKLAVDESKKWKPVNKQAAMIVRRATGLDVPLVEPIYIPSEKEEYEKSRDVLKSSIALKEIENKEWNKQQAKNLEKCKTRMRRLRRKKH